MTRLRLVLLAAMAVAVHAHEIGTTRVTATIEENGGYTIELAGDATALAEKLAAASGERLPDGVAGERLGALIKAHDALFRRRVQVAFDGAAVSPAVEYSVSGATANVRLMGQAPRGARQFTWTYGWTFASYALSVSAAGAAANTEWLEGNQTSTPYPLLSPSWAGRFSVWRYLWLGYTHIVPKGLDHMLFVLGIYLLSGRARTVLYQVSAFTVAHSITLGLSMYGLVSLSPKIVEPAIAISIAYVAIENILLKELKSWRIALVFTFGLLHGMGFAGALKELGLPRSEFLAALLTFNIGVEAGQLTVIGVAFLFVGWHFSQRDWYRARVVVPASAMIGCTAVYWTVARLLG